MENSAFLELVGEVRRDTEQLKNNMEVMLSNSVGVLESARRFIARMATTEPANQHQNIPKNDIKRSYHFPSENINETPKRQRVSD